MTVNKIYFDDLMRERHMSLRRLAELTNQYPAALSRTFNGKRRMKIEEAVAISKVLNVHLNEVILNAGIQEVSLKSRKCEIVGRYTAAGMVLLNLPEERTKVAVPEGLPDNVEAIQCMTTETTLSYMDGWTFFMADKADPHTLIDCFCLVETDDRKQIIGSIRRGYQPGLFNVITPMQETKRDVRITYARRIVMIKP